jgi:hypothetical protein
MSITAPTARVRTTSATERRTDNLRRIIDRLTLGECQRHEIEEMLAMSPSGSRKYIASLLDANVMYIARREEKKGYIHFRDHAEGAAVYALNPDTEVVDAFLAALELGPRVANKFVGAVCIDPDAPKQTSVAVWRCKIPEPDPLLAAFFGFAGA